MSSQQLNIDRYVVIHVATTCDEHGVYVTKDSAEVIELGWILVDATTLEEVRYIMLPLPIPFRGSYTLRGDLNAFNIILRLLTCPQLPRLPTRASLLSLLTPPLLPCVVSFLTLRPEVSPSAFSPRFSIPPTTRPDNK
jgi:hypothetical protein